MNIERMDKSTYDNIASWYHNLRCDDSLSLVDNLIYPHLFNLLNFQKRPYICDLGCGQGKLSRILAKKGAKVSGIDISKNLINIAIDIEKIQALGITYLQDNAETLNSIMDEEFDGVLCHMTLMDISNLEVTFKTIFRVLKKEGWFVFSITHPCFDSPHAKWSESASGKLKREIFEYLEDRFWKSKNPNGIRGKVGAYHRKLSTYINCLVISGFVLEQMIEPKATSIELDYVPGYAVAPIFLMIVSSKK